MPAKNQSMRRGRSWLMQILAVLFFISIPASAQKSAQPELLIQNGHRDTITAITCNADGSRLATGSRDYLVKLWDAKTGKMLNSFGGHSGAISSLAFSRNGDLIASGSKDGTVRLWSVKEGTLLRVLEASRSPVLCVAFSSDSRLLAAAGGDYNNDPSDTAVRLWETETGTLLHKMESNKGSVVSIAFSPDGEVLASAPSDGTVKFWSVRKGEIEKTFDNPVSKEHSWAGNQVRLVAFAPDGRSFATVDFGSIKIRSTDDGRVLRLFEGPKGGGFGRGRAAFSTDLTKAFVASNFGEASVLLDMSDGKLIKRVEAEGNEPVPCISSNGKIIAVAYCCGTAIVDGNSGEILRNIDVMGWQEGPVQFSRDGSILAWSSHGNINLWDVKNGVMIRSLSDKRSLKFFDLSLDGRLVATADSHGIVKVWSAKDGHPISVLRDLPDDNYVHDVYGLAFSPDGRIVAWGAETDKDSVVTLSNSHTGTVLRKVTVRDSLLDDAEMLGVDFSIAFSPDGKRMATGGNQQVVQIWDVDTGAPIRELKGHNYSITSISFSPDGKTIASAATDIRLWNADTGQLINSFGNHTDVIKMVTFSPDGKTIATASKDRTIKRWSVPNGTLLRSLDVHLSTVNSIAFSPDGKMLASSSDDGTTRLWSSSSGDWIVTLVAFQDGNWIAYTPDNYYKASPGCGCGVSWRLGDKIFDLSEYKDRFNKPEAVIGRLRGSLPLVATTHTEKEATRPRRSEASSVAAAEESLRTRFGFMRYSALVIGVGSYQSDVFGHLKTPERDAEDVAHVLKDDYGFEVELLPNATREQVLDALDRYRNRLDDNSSFLIYYAGHGYYINDEDVSYWQPADARPNRPSTWISTFDVVSRIRGMKARHILVVADSCFSGGFLSSPVAGQEIDEEPVDYLKKKMESASRYVMTSTDKDFIDDSGEGGHSLFTHAFIEELKHHPNNIFTAERSFRRIHDYVIQRRGNQRPDFGPIPNSSGRGRENTGNFVFIRNRQ